MVDDVEEPMQPQASGDVKGVEAEMTYAERPSYPARLRMIILLSLICWALAIAGVAWVAG
jgi:hypothetical protein